MPTYRNFSLCSMGVVNIMDMILHCSIKDTLGLCDPWSLRCNHVGSHAPKYGHTDISKGWYEMLRFSFTRRLNSSMLAFHFFTPSTSCHLLLIKSPVIDLKWRLLEDMKIETIAQPWTIFLTGLIPWTQTWIVNIQTFRAQFMHFVQNGTLHF